MLNCLLKRPVQPLPGGAGLPAPTWALRPGPPWQRLDRSFKINGSHQLSLRCLILLSPKALKFGLFFLLLLIVDEICILTLAFVLFQKHVLVDVSWSLCEGDQGVGLDQREHPWYTAYRVFPKRRQ